MAVDTTPLPDNRLGEFLARHRLPAGFVETARQYYLPLAERLPTYRAPDVPLMLGINGAQGTGKSTLADFLAMATEVLFDWRSAVLSIDDFYLTHAERRDLGRDVHPLFATRGVPGTHDTALMMDMLAQLRELPAGKTLSLPRFDKAIDDRAAARPEIAGPVDLVILEGWCVGSTAESGASLSTPVNTLERDEDPDATWRRTANTRLAEDYEPIFGMLDALVFLAAPSFDAVFRWRLEQEQKLADRSSGSAIMNEEQVERFIGFYERLTRHNLETLPQTADAVLTLDENHAVVAARYQSG